jgi:hypothetical protein
MDKVQRHIHCVRHHWSDTRVRLPLGGGGTRRHYGVCSIERQLPRDKCNVFNSIYYFICRLETAYNLTSAITTLGVQSWKGITSGGTRIKTAECHSYTQSSGRFRLCFVWLWILEFGGRTWIASVRARTMCDAVTERHECAVRVRPVT